MKRLISASFLLLFPLFFVAQGYDWTMGSSGQKKIRNLSIDGGIGQRMYVGDIQTKGSLFNKRKFAYGIGVRYQLNQRFGLELQGAGRSYAGKSNHGGYPDAIGEMNGKLWQGSISGQLDILRWEDFTIHQFTDRDPVTKINVYLGIGFGMSMFSASYTDRIYKTKTVKDTSGADSTLIFPVDKSGSGAGLGMYVPIQFGFRYRFKPNFYLNVELIQYQFYINKNIDGLATKKYDGMVLLPMVKVGYTFGQVKRKGDIKVKRRKK